MEWYDVAVTPTREGAWAAYNWSLPADAFIHTNHTEPAFVIDLVPQWDGEGGHVDAWCLLFFVERDGKAAFAGGFVTSEQFEQTFNDPTIAVDRPASLRPVKLFVGYGDLLTLPATARSVDGLYGPSIDPVPGEAVHIVLGAKGPGVEPFHVAFRTGEGRPSDEERLDPDTQVDAAIPLERMGAANGMALDYYARTTVAGVKFETWTAGIRHSDVANPTYTYQDNVNLERLAWNGGEIPAGWGTMGVYAMSFGALDVRGAMSMLNDSREVHGTASPADALCMFGGGGCTFVPHWGRFAEGSGSGPRSADFAVTNVGVPYVDQLFLFVVGMDATLESVLGLQPAGRGEAVYASFPPY
jgi:hypothetical protein